VGSLSAHKLASPIFICYALASPLNPCPEMTAYRDDGLSRLTELPYVAEKVDCQWPEDKSISMMVSVFNAHFTYLLHMPFLSYTSFL
jgi:hypothetical protein